MMRCAVVSTVDSRTVRTIRIYGLGVALLGRTDQLGRDFGQIVPDEGRPAALTCLPRLPLGRVPDEGRCDGSSRNGTIDACPMISVGY
jgi:hypothetical protein